jgi:hypothetical protein
MSAIDIGEELSKFKAETETMSPVVILLAGWLKLLADR